ncbi:PilT protein domain protein [Desulfamplus magnetovallimortis]|uniref:PilT protein domain protein n=1 Tax=Desulfamplus magnetovallimortis TaxID=1246637 RepID=A0A1W1H6Q4_9BACT|nr:putative toxin-antitoxin system toxin component, PIN family [Desulfamplus magnetovallimortis]SLM28170.1 PilT protein domain protein [Desulfamplus magnetovallimortis]
MKTYQIIIDTNVFVAALRSKNGASFRLLNLLKEKDARFKINVSTSIVLEYEAVLKREIHRQGKNLSIIDKFIDDLVACANRHQIFYLLRPHLKDADDDFILELAFSCSADYIITYNTKNFIRANAFGVSIMNPKDFLKEIGEI